MKPRDLAIVVALAVLVGAAAVDALRSGDSGGEAAAPTRSTAADERPRFERVPAPGRIVYTDDDCRLHEVHVATAEELPLAPAPAGCELWAPLTGERIAQSLPRSRNRIPFRLVDLDHPFRRLGTYASDGGVVFAPDGLVAGWCLDGRGFLLELGREVPERLPACPVGIAPNGRAVYADVRGLRGQDGRLIVETDSVVTAARFGADGTLGLVLGDAVEQYLPGRLAHRATLPAELSGRTPVLAPDACAALYPVGGDIVRAVNVCVPGLVGDLPGTDAAWSSDGEWIATVDDGDIAIRRVETGSVAARWTNLGARHVVWLG